MSRAELVRALYLQHYGVESEIVVHAPGRVNLIGDHTDYNEGLVLPAAINAGTDIAAATQTGNTVSVLAHDFDDSCDIELGVFEYDEKRTWVNYVAGTLKVLFDQYPELSGAKLVISGNIPQGAGLSSSASLEIAIIKTFATLFGLDIDGVKAALNAQKAENVFVGCNCGIMDQLISAMGLQGHAMLLDCQNLQIEDAPLPLGYSIMVINSNVKRGLVDSAYNERREQCETVARYFQKKSLRSVSIDMLYEAKPAIEDVLYRRAKHVITENARVKICLAALKSGDMEICGLMMKESHNSLRDDFEVTTHEMDFLVKIIGEVIGSDGGVRMTGGGFGGCVVALVPDTVTEKVRNVVKQKYYNKTGLVADVYLYQASQGAFRV